MRIRQLIALILVVALLLTLGREPLTRVFLVVFVTGLVEAALGLAATVALIQTVGAFGHAQTVRDHAESVAATVAVLFLGSSLMVGCLFIGCYLVLNTV